MVIAIDGPGGAGKSTLAKNLARKLGFLYLDSGALYRTVTWKVIKEKIKTKDAVIKILPLLKVDIQPDEIMRVWLDGEEVTQQIREPEVTREVWWVCRIKEVRDWVNRFLRNFSRGKNVVVEGRDMGSMVFPHAEIKIFLTAELSERARRRWEELQRKGKKISLREVEEELKTRDRRDSERDIAPLTRPPDAILVNNTGWEPEETLNKVLELIRDRL